LAKRNQQLTGTELKKRCGKDGEDDHGHLKRAADGAIIMGVKVGMMVKKRGDRRKNSQQDDSGKQ